MKTFLIAIIILILPSALFAETTVDRPYWSFELKGGLFIPDIGDWSAYYGNRHISEFGGTLAHKVLRQVEAGIEGTFIRDTGKGLAPIHTQNAGAPVLAGNVTYAIAPLNIFVVARGVFSENQWLIPYVGGGWTRIFYKEEIEYQGAARGYADGYHARGGIQLLLDALDPGAANNLYMDYGIHHTYLFIEARYTRAMIDTAGDPSSSINLGGTSWLTGLLFEF